MRCSGRTRNRRRRWPRLPPARAGRLCRHAQDSYISTSVKLAAGHSVREAYVQDGRGPVVGGGLKGLHHAKALLLVGDTTAELVVGSLNWTTSSKANSECGVHLVLASSSPVITDFSREFDRVSGSAERLEDANSPGAKPAAASSGAAQAPAPPTATI